MRFMLGLERILRRGDDDGQWELQLGLLPEGGDLGGWVLS
jgi:hypothetical protein